MSQLLLSVLGAVILLGAALFAAQRADRHRESRQQRLRALVAVGPSEDEPVLSLRRQLSRGTVRDFFLLSALWARLEAALAATGDRIGLPHLAVTGLIAAGLAGGCAAAVMGVGAALVPFVGAAGGRGAAALLLWRARNR